MQTKSSLVKIAVMRWHRIGHSRVIPVGQDSTSAQLHLGDLGQPDQPPPHPATQLSTAQKADWTHEYGQLPLAFEANQGQTAPDVRFLAHGQGYQLFLTSQEAVLTLRQPPPAGTKAAKGSHLLAGHTQAECVS